STDIATYGQAMTDPLADKAQASTQQLVQWSPQVMDVAQPIALGDQRLGGVRVGYSLAEMRAGGQRAASVLEGRLDGLSHRHTGWVLLLLLALGAVCVGMFWYMQRTLVWPIRRMAQA